MDTLTVAMLAGAAGFFVAAALGALALNRADRRVRIAQEQRAAAVDHLRTALADAGRARGEAATLNDALNNIDASLRATRESLTALQAVAYVRKGRSFRRWTSINA